ncbi:DEAD/DEAH box helicase family protein [Geobacter sp.]|uniref:DEAD/DEAH box helicase family protein n=1 Tax=Geobacter sp. TaxID=46610 RepID=UPI0027BA9596|nr:DEAD/DEAH box helicase family protein [Geobacter sp.]
MARPKKATAAPPARGNGEYVKLEQRLVLAAWGCQMLGYADNKAMLENLREVEEGFDTSGRSFLAQTILARGKCLVSREDLLRYDGNIKSYLAQFNRHRTEPLRLRYFQHLSLLLTELLLDQLFNHEKTLRRDLNEFVSRRNSRKGVMDPQDPEFGPEDLTKLAFWMATGSGKTILMHFHYRQFLHYNRKPLDNILLVTPDEGLSQQHLEQMTLAGIPCARFVREESGLATVAKNTVRVFEITKLVEEKKGSGVSVPVEAFEGNNLIFVDEGHKGASSEAGKWIGYRNRLAETGFTFEYSATFGQAMTAARDDAMTREYGKAILFDYSYKYFYGDGFGKDFEVLNLRRETTDEQARMLLLANLLAFYEQKRTFQTRSDEMLRYHLADPLWVFVGSTVNKSKDNKQARESDVLTVVKFFDAFIRNERNWVQKDIEQIMAGRSDITDDGVDIFAGRFKQLAAWSKDGESIYRDLLERVFQTSSGGRLHVGDIKGKSGELGLKVSGAERYFGLVYIGDTASFKALIEEECKEIELEEDRIAESLFDNIKKPDSPINILVGAKKFMSGWDSWRVTNMGLLNIGRSEGSEIIQLFGRGVRLQGKGHSLKRSSALPGGHPSGIEVLERLNIFAVRANYMAQFREYLEREGLDTGGMVELPLPIKRNDAFLKKKLIAPRLPKESRFAESERFMLCCNSAVRVTLDMSVQVERLGSSTGAFQSATYLAGEERRIGKAHMALLDWEALYLEMLAYKEEQGFHNLVIRPEHPLQILTAEEPALYGLICDETLLKPVTTAQAVRLQAIAGSVLKKYLERFYRLRQQRWDSSQMVYAPLQKDDPNFQDYVVKVPRNEAELIEGIKETIDEGKRLYREMVAEPPTLYFDRHLYQPLLVQKGNTVKTSPPGLNESERRFVQDLMVYCHSSPSELEGKELFLLRNLSRGKGIGFFENSGFYPDFILWVTEGKLQRLVFIEPHGMLNEEHPSINPKIYLHKKLQDQAAAVLKKSKVRDLTLDAYVLSVTPFSELRKRHGEEWTKAKYADAHILFFGDGDSSYIKMIVSGTLP